MGGGVVEEIPRRAIWEYEGKEDVGRRGYE